MLRCRKNQATLTSTERTKFVNAVLAIKANGTYDQFVDWHLNNMPGAHRGPAFLPWHRIFLHKFEEALRAVDPAVTLPYWDWTVDQSPAAAPWAVDFMGGNGRPSDGWVIDGPFAHATGNFTLIFDGPALRRRFALSPSAPTLPSAGDLVNALAATPYDVAPWSDFSSSGFRNTLEGWIAGPQLHNRVHVWVGGSMAPASSPNDPIFFLHHCFIDKIWADWQSAHPGLPYLPSSGAATGHNINDVMEPWASMGEIIRPADTLDHHALGYAYDTEGVCAPTLKIIDDPLPTLKVVDDLPTLKLVDDRPTFKFLDDRPTFKVLDDRPTLKVIDDPQTLKAIDDGPTIKAVDDPQTLKTLDDGPTLKATDDPQTLKFNDDGGGTLKFADDGTLKNIDDAKGVGLDKNPASDGAGGFAGGTPRNAPFVLSTPHHSMAWTRTFPGSLEATLRHYEAEMKQYESAIQQLTEAQQNGALSEEGAQQLHALTQSYLALLQEYRLMAQQG